MKRFVVAATVWAMGLAWVLGGVAPVSASAQVPQEAGAAVSAVSTPGGLTSLAPSRLLDTRDGTGLPSNLKAAVPGGGTVHLQVAGRGGVPASGVSAVVLNVTVASPSASGFATVFGEGAARPTASNLNFVKNQIVPNLVIAPVGAGGKVALYNGSGGSVQLIADVAGYYLAGAPVAAGAFGSLAPSRLLDTRDGTGVPVKAAVPAGGTVHLQVTGRGGVPAAGVSAVVLNVTVAAPTWGGFVTVFGDGAARPTASNLNFVKAQVVPNLVIAPVGAGGKVALYNGSGGTVQVIADVSGWFLGSTATFPTVPAPTISGNPSYGSTLHANPGSWGVSGVAFKYQWLSNGAPIGGATGADYTVASINIGQTISVVVTGSAPGYAGASAGSAPTPAIPTPPVTGTAATRTQRMSGSNLNSTQIGWYEAGARLTLVCYQRGQSVKGYFSSSFPTGWDNLWYRISDGSYAADVDIETGTLDPVVPACADQPVADTTNSQVMATTQRMSSDTLNSTQNGVYSAGSRLTLSCYLHGQAVKGYFSGSFPNGYDDLWYQVNDGSWVADVDIQTGSNNPVTPACAAPPPPPPVSSDEITRAKSWIDAKVPYSQGTPWYTNQYGTYRRDCSGFVSMALGLPSSYTTVTLPQVMHPISKDQLQPGDFMLNSSGSDGHVAIFMGWTDASHAHYASWEENGVQGYAFVQVVPYPYWSSWSGSSNYKPYRRN